MAVYSGDDSTNDKFWGDGCVCGRFLLRGEFWADGIGEGRRGGFAGETSGRGAGYNAWDAPRDGLARERGGAPRSVGRAAYLREESARFILCARICDGAGPAASDGIMEARGARTAGGSGGRNRGGARDLGGDAALSRPDGRRVHELRAGCPRDSDGVHGRHQRLYS